MEKPLKKKICPQNCLLPISVLQNIFASQYSFLPPNDFLLAKNSPKILLAKLPPQKNLLLQNMLPKISSQENFFQKIVPHFAPLIFIQKNLLLKFFLPRICCQTFLLSIFLLTMNFTYKNSSKIFLLAKFPPHKNLSSKTWSPKFSLKKICFKKKLFPTSPSPPPPPHFFSFKRICSPHISSQNLLPNIFALHITSHKKLLHKFCSPKIFAAQITLWSSYGTWLIQVQWQGIVRCMQRFY